MKTVPHKFFIQTNFGPILVDGFAVDSPTGVRYCVRSEDKLFGGYWTTTHYDSGYLISSIDGSLSPCDTMNECINATEAFLKEKIANGGYAIALKKIGMTA